MSRVIGRGTPTWVGAPLEGMVKEVTTPDDVLDLLDDTPPGLIVLMHTAGATTLSPLFGDLAGLLCTTGSEGSHVAILAREFGIPCLVGTQLDGQEIDGRRVRMEPSGEVLLLDAD